MIAPVNHRPGGLVSTTLSRGLPISFICILHIVTSILTGAEMKKFILLTLIGTITYFVVGWLVFDLILGTYTEANTTQLAGFKRSAAEFNWLFLVTSCAAYAALVVYILAHLTRTTDPVKGTIAGAVVGILVAIMANTYWLASSHFYNNVAVAFVDVAGAAVAVGLLGLVTTLVSRRLQ